MLKPGAEAYLWDTRALFEIPPVIEVVAALAHLHRLSECSLEPHAREVETKRKQVVDVVPGAKVVTKNKTMRKQLDASAKGREGELRHEARRAAADGLLQARSVLMKQRLQTEAEFGD